MKVNCHERDVTQSVAIVGHGAVGSFIEKLFPQASIFDEPLQIGTRQDVNKSDVAFVAVPTPMGQDGRCDSSIVEEVVAWITTPLIIIRSTVSVGTTDRLRASTGKNIIFQPEYGPGETPGHPYADPTAIDWVILGGPRQSTRTAIDLYATVLTPTTRYFQTDGKTAELVKYMENAYLAMKVTFCNEFYDIANAMGIDYHEARELWLQDPRVGRSHTMVSSQNRGFHGKCLPKDVSEIAHLSEDLGIISNMFSAMMRRNSEF